ncbi:hypothetical protein AA313_de0209977 [Arthrobotrys entomopaga]|nr:hypothetical protein AA313_de0209977 [Arthrobotrys entomopaga]
MVRLKPEDKPGYDALSQISSYYGSLRPLLLDLVGDYAGQELFFIEGDSLCLHILNDKSIEIDDGPEVVHGIYVLERFLSNLKERGCNFHIIFFEAHKPLCFDHSKVHENQAFRYILIREAFIRHLKQSLSTNDAVQLHHFDSLGDIAFKRYLDESNPYFCMAHDACTSDGQHMEQFYLQSTIIWHIIGHGYNVALLDKVEFKDSKVMTLVVEGHGMDQFDKGFIQKARKETAEAIMILEVEFDMDEKVRHISLSDATLPYLTNPREHIIIAAMAHMASVHSDLARPISKDQVNTFGYSFLKHAILMDKLTLEQRCLPSVLFTKKKELGLNHFIDVICRSISMAIGETANWEEILTLYPGNNFQVSDIIDIRLFEYCLADGSFGEDVSADIKRLCEAYEAETNMKLVPLDASSLNAKVSRLARNKQVQAAVLPFKHPSFDSHLSSVKLDIDETEFTAPQSLHRLAQERTHWHSTMALKGVLKTQNKWQLRSDQVYHAHMQRYAASITGRTAQTLEPELILVGDNSKIESKGVELRNEGPNGADGTTSEPPKETKATKAGKSGKGGKYNASSGRKKADLIREENTKAKTKKTEDRALSVWAKLLEELTDAIDKTRTRSEHEEASLSALAKISDFQKSKFKGDQESYIYLETKLYRLRILLDLWGQACGISEKEKKEHQNLGALIFDECRHIMASPALTKNIYDIVKNVWIDMGFGKPILTTAPKTKEKLPSHLDKCRVKPEMRITQSPVAFQLTHSGPYMDRSFGSTPDRRVKFQPDTWQREVLDQIDANNSVFVVAPTSAGKTFISFYAMEKVLRGSNDGILVYVAPTKALVNQIAAEVLARFTKKYPNRDAGQTVWAIHTRDYRINNPEKCQILVTVPHILQIMLLSPHNAGKWAPKVKRIIFDEIHSIGQADDGVIWEQLLLIAPCPIIALSATVGNPEEFRDWLIETQKAAGMDLTMIQHQHRYSDLRKFIFKAPVKEVFKGLGQRRHFQELDDEPAFKPINPISTLTDVKHRQIPDDLSLEPRDCLELYILMVKHQTKKWPIDPKIAPSKHFDGVIGKVNVVEWENILKKQLESWMTNSGSPYDRVMQELKSTRDNINSRDPTETSGSVSPSGSDYSGQENVEDDAHDNDVEVRETTLSLLSRLHAKNALPAILFSFDRTMVEKIVKTIVKQLEDAEAVFKKTDPNYLHQVEQHRQWVKEQSQRQSKPQEKASTKKSKSKTKSRDDDIDAMKNERDQDERGESSKWASFDPDAPHEKFQFVGNSNREVEEDFEMLRKASISEVFISALRRGIGIHHAGLSRRLREVTETLFRMGYLQVVIATGTLALGINMPCKTVGFIGDSVYLTALAYRQCSGRAGRRGFDLFGNVVFHGLAPQKVNRLISSRLPSLKGHFPISTSLVLRMFSLIDGSKESRYSNDAINQLLSQPRLFLGGKNFKEQVLHHLRFSIEYLRRQHLIDGNGRPINFAGLVGHLYYTQNSAFAFHALLKDGVFHTICKDVDRMPQKTCLILMHVMAHLFGRRRCKNPKDMSEEMLETIKRSPSEVFLKPLPKIAGQALVEHNRDTMRTFTSYVSTFADQYCQNIPDNILPFSKVAIGKTPDETSDSEIHARSTFYRLSGHDDTFKSVKELAASARNGVFLEASAIPIINIEGGGYYNSYLLDFYKHGSQHPLIVANGLRKNDVWFMLNDFSMILATVVTSIKNFFSEGEKGSSDDDVLNLMAMGEGEEIDTDEDEEVFTEEDAEGEIDMSDINHAALKDNSGMLKVFKAFLLLRQQFDAKLAAIGATKKKFDDTKQRKPRLRV